MRPWYFLIHAIVMFLLLACEPRTREQLYQPTEAATQPTPEGTTAVNRRKPRKQDTVQDSLLDAIRYVKDTALIAALVKRGADVNQRDENLFYPLYWSQYDQQYQVKKDAAIINFLLTLGAIDYNARLDPFFQACENGNLDSVKLLLRQRSDINSKKIWYDPPEEDASCNCFETPLAASVRSGNLQLVKFLLDNGAEINTSPDGVQPLAVALQKRMYKIADLLIERGAEKKSTFAIEYPFYFFEPEDTVYLDYLVSNGFEYQRWYASDSPLKNAARTGNISVLKRLIPVTDIEERSSAMCFSESIKASNLLLKSGAKVNTVYNDVGEGGCNTFRTPLTTAVEVGDLSYIKYLVNNGADVNFLDSYMDTDKNTVQYLRCSIKSPLTLAILDRKTDIAHYLIDRAANVNFIIVEQREEKFISPLIAAVQANDAQMTKLLLQKGATAVNNGVSIQEYVTGSTSSQIVEALGAAK